MKSVVAKPWNKGKVGMYSKEYRKKLSLAHKGKSHTEERKKKISQTLKGRPSGMKGKHHTEYWKRNHKKFMEGNQFRKGISHTEETKRKLSEANKGKSCNKGIKHTIESNKKRSKTMIGKNIASTKKLWQCPDYVKKQMRSRGVAPNKIELHLQSILNELYPNDFKYVGDGEVIIAGKCPDFININGKKQIIELFGDYWHRGEKEEDRIKIFEPYGYKTLVIWERELKDIDKLAAKLKLFVAE